MGEPDFDFTGELWRHPGDAGWHFVTVPAAVADEIDAAVEGRAGFGSIPVEVTVGSTTWRTSLFPDRQAGSFVLPVRRSVRAAEGLEMGAAVTVRLRHDAGRR